MCALVPQDKSEGGLPCKSIYIDTEGTFRGERIAVIAKTRGFDRSTVDNVMIEQTADSDQ
jgi:RecA/RadA recombinase